MIKVSFQRLGMPESLDRIDGAVRWGYNDKTYFFSGTKTRNVSRRDQGPLNGAPKEKS